MVTCGNNDAEEAVPIMFQVSSENVSYKTLSYKTQQHISSASWLQLGLRLRAIALAGTLLSVLVDHNHNPSPQPVSMMDKHVRGIRDLARAETLHSSWGDVTPPLK